MRTNLKVFRVQHNLSQDEMANKIGCSRSSYSCIEIGTRDGRTAFWNKLQSAFEIPAEDMYRLMENVLPCD